MQVVMFTLLYAMYQQSKKMFIFLVVVFLAITIACGVMVAIGSSQVSGGKL